MRWHRLIGVTTYHATCHTQERCQNVHIFL